MSLTEANIITAVNAELENLVYVGAADSVGDAATTTYHIAPLGYYILDDDSFIVSIDDVVSGAYDMDFVNGDCEFEAAPAANTEIYWQFHYQPWPTAVITEAVTAAIDSLYPYFYTITSDEQDADGDTTEFELEAGETVTRVMSSTTGEDPWVTIPRKKYELLNFDGDRVLRFFTAPSDTTLRILSVSRPAVADLPDRAKAPLVSYACYYLIVSKTAPRVRSDVAIATQGSGTLSPRQMADAANAFYLRYQMQLAQMKQQPYSIY